MRTIKKRNATKTIKALDKSVDISTHMKNAFVRTKEKAEETQNSQHASPTDYASGNIQDTAQNAAEEAVYHLPNPRKEASKSFENAKRHFREAKRQLPKERKQAAEQAQKAAHDTRENADKLHKAADHAKEAVSEAKQAAKDAKQSLREARRTAREAKRGGISKGEFPQSSSGPMPRGKYPANVPETQSCSLRPGYLRKGVNATNNAGSAAQSTEKSAKNIKSAAKGFKDSAKGSVKTAQKSVKTAEQTAKAAVKTAQQTAKAAQKAAKAAKVAEKAAHAAAKVSVQAAKAATRATVAMVKLAIAAIKGLISAIVAGGWVSVLIILVICLIGLLLSSVFGIFFSSETSENGMTMKSVVAEINGEFSDEIARIIAENYHDDYTITSKRAPWKEVLAVYAVKTNTDPDNPLEVATIDEQKANLLLSVFWDMNIIDYWIQTIKHTSTYTDAEGNTETDTWYEYILHITVKCKSATEMANMYGFNTTQRAQLKELLDPAYDDLWRAVLYGWSSGNGSNIVEVAISQIGNVGGEIYWSWYGFDSHVNWCACFVSWCANECGYIEAGIIQRFAGCQSQGIPWFKTVDLWQDSGSGYLPKPGDIIFFDWEVDGWSDHVGIVEYVEDGRIHTVEGNSGDSCRRRSYSIDSSLIVGYGTPSY